MENKTNTKQKSTLNLILWATFYLLVVFVMCISGSVIFFRNYYSPVYIDGESMCPTLNNDNKIGIHDLGLVDFSSSCIDSIERFDIVTCYYPPALDSDDYPDTYQPGLGIKPLTTAEHKIKRVMALPGDTFSIKDNVFYLYENSSDQEGEIIDFPFDIKKPGSSKPKNVKKMTLKDDEYFVMGDNWVDSNDCSKYQIPIYKENIVGVLIAIIGTCRIETVNGQTQIFDKQYHWPVFYK